MSSLKWFIKSVWEHVQDAWNDIKKLPQDVIDSVRNWILRQPQTLRDYNITTDLSLKELSDTIEWFHSSNIQNIKSWIAENLILAMDRKNFPINVNKSEKIYRETVTIEELYQYEWTEIIDKIKNILDQDIKSIPKEEIIERIKYIFKESNNDVLKSTKQKIRQRLSQYSKYDQSYIENENNEWMKAINETYELITYKFALRAYQLLCHDNQENNSETAKEIYKQAKDFAYKQSKEYITQKLTPQDTLSLQLYNYNTNFWNTHIKDGNNPEDLILFKPHAPRPTKPNIERPQKPKSHDYECVKDYERAMQNWRAETRQLKQNSEYKKRNEWTEKTEWMKDILKAVLDVWPLNRLSNGIIKRISAVLERWWWAWVQHTIETVFRPNILKMSPEEEELLRHILVDVYYGWKKCFIVLNHETFANIPITLVKFMQVAHEMNMENINEYFTTVIWPLLATHKKQNALLNSLSSILVTHPADNKIPSAKTIYRHQQQNAWSQFEKDLTKENPRWQIYFCAPSWTRDIVHYWDDWVPQIFIPDASWWSNITTAKQIRLLHSQNPDLRVYAVSTNTTDLKKPNPQKDVSPNNNKWNKNATVSMHLQEINKDDLSSENITSSILSGISHPIPSLQERRPSRSLIKRRRNKWKKYYDYDENGKVDEVPCAIAIPPIIFQYLKKFTKTPQYSQTWQLPKIFFNENGKLDLDSEVFKLLQKFAKTSEYSRGRKIPSRFFDEKWFIKLDVLKWEISEKAA